MKYALLVCSLIILSSVTAASQDYASGVFHGTINIVLANANGIVALTDSMVTQDGRQMPELPYQKLYKLDDQSVCTIAGFLAGPGPAHAYVDASALIRQYADELKRSSLPPQTIREKLKALTFLFRSDLSSLATLRAAADQQRDFTNFTSQVTVAGFDTDGIARIAQVTLSVAPRSFGFLDFTPSGESVAEVGKTLVPRLAGIRYIADRLLAEPSSVSDDAVLADYDASMRKGQGESLTIGQMRTLAVRLAAYTANEQPGVGGPNQIAVLEHTRLASLELPNFPRTNNLSLPRFVGVVDSLLIESQQVSPPSFSSAFFGNVPILYLQNTFKNEIERLDGNYFFHNVFAGCVLRYEGDSPFTSTQTINSRTLTWSWG